MDWYPRNPAHYDRDTLGLTLAEHGAYTRLMDYYYQTEQPLPSDARELAAICRCGLDEWNTVRDRVLRYFTQEQDGKLHQKRCDLEIADYRGSGDVSRANGQKGGRPRKPDNNPAGSGQDAQGKPGGPPQRKKQTNKHRKKDSDEPPPYTPEFERAWSQYPARAGGNPKKDAFKAWNARLKAGRSPQEMTEGVIRYAAYCTGTQKINTEFVMQGQRFFGPSDPPHFTLPWTPPRGAQTSGAPSRAEVVAREIARQRDDGQRGQGG